MRKRLLLILSLIVLVPLLLLGWLGSRLAEREAQAREHQARLAAEAQLAATDTLLAGVFNSLAAELIQLAAFTPTDTDALRRLPHAHPRIRQVFVMSAQGERRFPPEAAPLTTAETEFLARTETLWRDHGILYENRPSDAAPAAPAGRSYASRAESKASALPPHGWYLWHAGAETNHIFWVQRPNGDLLGFELHPARLLADLIAALPATGAETDRLSRFRLIDAGGKTVYQWGGLKLADDAKATAVLPLSHPLSSWRLAYYGAAAPTGHAYSLALALAAAAAALLGLAVYFYREHTRDLRLAAQRVSFVNQVSHELKTPLTNIRLYAELLEQDLPDDEPAPRRHLDVIQAESRRLSRLINNVLSFARAERGRLTLNPRPGVVDGCVESTLDAFRPALAAKGVAVETELRASATVRFDPDALEQILVNLFSNVEKYGAAGQWLGVSSRQEPGRVVVEVRDRGPGIPAAERERVFEPFYRLSDRVADGVAGTGIGLSIARDLARLHGGDLVLLVSDQGAAFQLTLRTEEAA